MAAGLTHLEELEAEAIHVLRETAANFSNFMLHSRRHFWRLGNNLNGIYHVLTIWDRATRRSVDRTLPVQQMIELLRIMRELL